MEELALQSIIEMALGNEMQAKDYVSKHVKGAARWYYDETDYQADLDLTTFFRDEE
jgi:hypothetical protein